MLIRGQFQPIEGSSLPSNFCPNSILRADLDGTCFLPLYACAHG